MYGMQETTAGGAVLAGVGLSTGAWVLAVIGVILALIALWHLVRKPGKDRP